MQSRVETFILSNKLSNYECVQQVEAEEKTQLSKDSSTLNSKVRQISEETPSFGNTIKKEYLKQTLLLYVYM